MQYLRIQLLPLNLAGKALRACRIILRRIGKPQTEVVADPLRRLPVCQIEKRLHEVNAVSPLPARKAIEFPVVERKRRVPAIVMKRAEGALTTK